mmetsp:Transcript_2008/g.4720  ORF Transcript_2008/g.4720 Transcript_2008/m.4720 type:complete len:396 (-) Transcript_2008:42-1229(-)
MDSSIEVAEVLRRGLAALGPCQAVDEGRDGNEGERSVEVWLEGRVEKKLSPLDQDGAREDDREDAPQIRGFRDPRGISRRRCCRHPRLPRFCLRSQGRGIAGIREDAVGSCPAGQVSHEGQHCLEEDEAPDGRGVVEEVVGACAQPRGVERDHRDGQTLPSWVPGRLGVPPDEAHGSEPLDEAGDVDHPRRERERVCWLRMHPRQEPSARESGGSEANGSGGGPGCREQLGHRLVLEGGVGAGHGAAEAEDDQEVRQGQERLRRAVQPVHVRQLRPVHHLGGDGCWDRGDDEDQEELEAEQPQRRRLALRPVQIVQEREVGEQGRGKEPPRDVVDGHVEASDARCQQRRVQHHPAACSAARPPPPCPTRELLGEPRWSETPCNRPVPRRREEPAR